MPKPTSKFFLWGLSFLAMGALMSTSATTPTNYSDLNLTNSALLVLLHSNNSEVSQSTDSNCYTYVLPANNYSKVQIEGFALYNGTTSGNWKAMIELNGSIKEDIYAGADLGLLTFQNTPMSLKYVETDLKGGSNITMDLDEISGTSTVLCKGFYVYGVW